MRSSKVWVSVFAFSLSLLELSAAEGPSYLKTYPAASYHQLVSGGLIVGKSASTWKMQGQNIEFGEVSSMKLTLFKKPQDISTDLKVVTDASLRIQSFDFSMKTSEASLKVKGERLDNAVRLRVFQGTSTQTKDVPIQEPLLLSPTIRPFALMKGLPKATVLWDGHLLEPSALTTIPLKLKLTAGGSNSWSLDVMYLSQSLKSEINSSGALLKEKSDLAGFPIEATPVSKVQYDKLNVVGSSRDLVEVAKVSFPTIKDPRALKEFAVKISGIDLSLFQLNRHRQVLKDNVLTIRAEKGSEGGSPHQTLTGRRDLEPYLRGDASLPIFDPLIQKKAREIVGTEPNLWKRAVLIHDFVYKNVQKTPTVSVPNALEVLQTLRGDCNEHAALYTALSRAAGVPTRIVVGLVYGERFTTDSGFYYHAWVEVFDGKDWIAIDPTWNQIPADPTHIAFVEGGLEQQVLVTSLMGKISLSPATPQKAAVPNR